MSTYEFVMVRFNMGTDEREIYNKLNSGNRAGHIKTILKEKYIYNQQVDPSSIENILMKVLSHSNFKENDVIKYNKKENEIESFDFDNFIKESD